MTRILAVGCSITKGHGLPGEINHPDLWVNQLTRNFFGTPAMVNLSQSGVDNHWIFSHTAQALINDHYDAVFVGWTSTSRLYWNVGLELYHTGTNFYDNSININPGQTISGSWLKKIGDDLKKIQNDHWKILDLVRYVNILNNLATQKSTQIFFVNSLAHWNTGFFDKKDLQVPSELSEYEQELLTTDTRADEEVFRLYDYIHRQYQDAGGIHPEQWLNLYQSLWSNKQDTVSLKDPHPGLASQEFYAKMLGASLETKLK